MDEHYTCESDDERLVRAALLAAYPPYRSKFSMRRGEQILRAAAAERLERRSTAGGRVAASLAAAFTLLAGTAGAAGAAMPGQPLYPLKRIVERAMVAVAADDSDAAELELRFAERRLDEAAAVTDEPVASELAEQFNEHINAANALAGEEIADDVDQLHQSRVESDSTTAVAAPSSTAPPNDQTTPAITTSPSPTPSPSPSPSPGPSATPSPSPSASPSPTPSVDPSADPLLSGPGLVSPSAPTDESQASDGTDHRSPVSTDTGDLETSADRR